MFNERIADIHFRKKFNLINGGEEAKTKKSCSQTSVGGCRSVKGKRDAPAELDEEDIPGQTTLYGGGGAEI
ncbi:hypothetical protein T02_327 [Trichinella nativa]|uniref:Uncharacterized protein n=1 Tax=Trichinella nativa TaxID=6335 RepID=A0A0V1LI91_9BILA|nr:hypothetical protein T02_327 [Trichinella nativa]